VGIATQLGFGLVLDARHQLVPELGRGGSRIRGQPCGRTKKKRVGLEASRLTKEYGIDCFPQEASQAYRQYWLRESVPLIRLEERLRSGEVPVKDLYDAVLELTGCEELASEAYTNRVRAMIKAGQWVDV